MQQAVFDGVSLRVVDFSYAKLLMTTFRSSWLGVVTFEGASLAGADFSDATLNLVNFSNAMLFGAKFYGVEIREESQVQDIDVSGAQFCFQETCAEGLSAAVVGRMSFQTGNPPSGLKKMLPEATIYECSSEYGPCGVISVEMLP